MSTVERGLSNLSLNNLERIAHALGVPAGILLLEADELAPHGLSSGRSPLTDSQVAPTPKAHDQDEPAMKTAHRGADGDASSGTAEMSADRASDSMDSGEWPSKDGAQ